MILVDANLLLYAVNRDAPLHGKAKNWLEATLNSDEDVGIPWNVVLAFLRLATRPGLFAKPLAPEAALDLVASWFDRPNVFAIQPGARHLEILRRLIVPLGTAGNLTSDAHLAAIAVELGARLYSCDNDFARFPELNWKNPLA